MLVSRLPFWVIYRISDILYFISYYLIGYRKKVVFSNLYLAFPEKSAKEIKQIAKNSYKHFADILVESIKAFSISRKELDQRYTFKNTELFQELAHKNKSIALVGSHYANWEWGIHLKIYTPHDVFGSYTKLTNPYFNNLICRSRGKFGFQLVPTSETIPMIKNNKVNDVLSLYILLSDQSPMLQKTVYWNEFLGVKVPIHVGAETLSKKYDLAVVYFSVDKIKRGFYEVTFKLLAEDSTNYKNYEITDHFLKLVEEQIKRKPAFYFWTHNRFKHKDKMPVLK